MFVVTDKPTFWRTVKVFVPVDGAHREDTFRAKFNVLEIDQIEAFDLSSTEGNTAFLCAAVEELDDIVGGDKQKLPYTDELRDAVFQLPYARVALVREYFEATGKARKGNSK